MPTTIEWTRGADGSPGETWNPTLGCSRVSPGCDGCYAIGVAHRKMQAAHVGLTVVTEHGPDWTGEVRCLPERLDTPLRWRKPRRVFVDSMSDLFHPDVPDDFIAAVYAVMSRASRHTFQILTKRPQRRAKLLDDFEFVKLVDDHRGADAGDFAWPIPNGWEGVSVENQRYADLRIPHLLATTAAVRFLSCEPLLGPIDLRAVALGACPDQLPTPCEGARIDWVIGGGESGRNARACHPRWARQLRDQCVAAGVPFTWKQWGAWRPFRQGDDPDTGVLWDGTDDRDELVSMVLRAPKGGGRDLDGRTWDEKPEPAA